jgi:integrase/recombinase XerC
MTQQEIDAARMLLSRLGVTPEQLLGATGGDRSVPTFGEYIPRVSDAVPPATRRVYGTYWRRTLDVWSERRIDEPTPLEITQLVERVRGDAVVRRNSRSGSTAAEHLIGALRCMYRYAVADNLVSERDNPAQRVPKPRRLASTRRALPDALLAQVNAVAATTGNDPELDTLLLRLHEETACRRGGALALAQCDLDLDQCLLRLSEKGGTVRWQPISPSLTRHLQAHCDERVDRSHSQLLRYRNGRPITARRYDHLWSRVGAHLPWVATQQVTTHWLRHTTLTWVERNFGYAITRAYAGHSGNSAAGVTSTYVRADLAEIARALSALTGERHPLATPPHLAREVLPLSALL